MKRLLIGAVLNLFVLIVAAPPSVSGYYLVESENIMCPGGTVVIVRDYAHPNGRWVQRRWSTAGREFAALYAVRYEEHVAQRLWIDPLGIGEWQGVNTVMNACEIAQSVRKVCPI